MSTKLAKSTFSTGPTDSLASIDVYKESSSIINSIQALTSSSGVDVSSLLGKASSTLSSVLNLTQQGLTVNKDTLKARLLGTSSNISSAYTSLTKQGISGTATSDLSNSQKSYITTSINGVSSKVDSTNFNSLSSIGTFINDYTGTTAYSTKDNDAIASLLGSVVSEGSSLKLTGVFSALTSGITDKTLVNKVADKSISSALTNTDLDTLYDISVSSAGQYLNENYSDYNETLSSNFNVTGYNEGNTSTEAMQLAKIVSIFSNTKADWNRVKRVANTAVVSSIVKMMGGNAAWKQMILTGVKAIDDSTQDDNYYKSKTQALASVYAKTDVVTDIHKYFPKVVLEEDISALKKKSTTTTNKTTGVVDPTILALSTTIVSALLS